MYSFAMRYDNNGASFHDPDGKSSLFELRYDHWHIEVECHPARSFLSPKLIQIVMIRGTQFNALCCTSTRYSASDTIIKNNSVWKLVVLIKIFLTVKNFNVIVETCVKLASLKTNFFLSYAQKTSSYVIIKKLWLFLRSI